jgi:2-polyprenyl-3-methyl-5-hydroxy-6-metoxy-1,4-benzoquinol methylase
MNDLIERPAMKALLGEVPGKRTLEVGCGLAHYSRWLAGQGAEAWGLEPAPRLLTAAGEMANADGVVVTLWAGGVERLPEYTDGQFDIVLFPMMLEYVDDLEETFRQAHRILKPDGFVAISIVHPMRNLSVKHVLEGGEEARIVSGYLNSGVYEWSLWIMKDEEGNDLVCRSHRRTIQEHVEPLVGAGFLIEALVEPDAAPEAWHTDAARCRENRQCPQFMLVKAVKDPRRL